MPFGVLRRSDVADVVALATKPGPVKLYPTLTVEPQATAAPNGENGAAGSARRHHSIRSAFSGSIREARTAGGRIAQRAMTVTAPTATA